MINLSDHLPETFTSDPLGNDRIRQEMDRISDQYQEELVQAFAKHVQGIIQDLEPLAQQEDYIAISTYRSNPAPLAAVIFLMWDDGYKVGGAQAIAGMIRSLPQDIRQNPDLLRPIDAANVRELIKIRRGNTGFRNLTAEAAVRDRSFTLAGNFLESQLSTLKTIITQGFTVVPDLGRPLNPAEQQAQIGRLLDISKARAQTITQTETTYALNQGRLTTYRKSNLATHLLFIPIDDTRTTRWCRSRMGMVFPIDQVEFVKANTPPLHYRCRSVVSALLPIIPEHKLMIDDPTREPGNRVLEPLLSGWRN